MESLLIFREETQTNLTGQSMTIKLGTGSDNDIVIQGETVSRTHASIESPNDGGYVLIDLDSKNGTFVNNRRILKRPITVDDQIRLGSHAIDSTAIFDQIKKIQDKHRTDYTQEYSTMFTDFESYQDQKDRIVKKPMGPLVLRVVLSMIVIILLIGFRAHIPDAMIYPLILGVGLVTMVASSFSGSTKKKNDQLAHLRLAFEETLVCPKCECKLINENLTYLKGRKKCINGKCDATYEG